MACLSFSSLMGNEIQGKNMGDYHWWKLQGLERATYELEFELLNVCLSI